MMNLTRREVLASSRGFATVFGLGIMAIIMVFAMGVAMINFQSQSVLISQTKNMAAAIESRANKYVAEMNVSMTDDSAVPSPAYTWDARTQLSTQITFGSNNADGSKTIHIHAQSENGKFSLDRAVAIEPTKVSHVTGFDSAGNPIWALAAGTTPYTLWGFTKGDIRPLTTSEQAGQVKTGSEWRTTSHHMGIDSAGKIWAWGTNSNGQVGNGTTSDVASPVSIMPSRTFRDIVSDSTSSFAIDTQGSLWAWGSNSNNKLGLGGQVSTPTRHSLDNTIQAVATGGDQSYAIDSRGRLWGWGYNGGQGLGTGAATATVGTPQQVSPGQTFRSVTTDGGSTFAIDTSGRLWAWGQNASGQLGLGSASGVITQPRHVYPGDLFASVDTSGNATAAISTNGQLFAWGDEWRSGNRSSARTMYPSPVYAPGTFSVVAVNSTTSYALSSSGQLYVWGLNNTGQYGDGSVSYDATPRQVLAGTSFVSISADTMTSAVDSRGALWTFGRAGAGLWPIAFAGSPNAALKMPFPSGFTPSGWK